MPKNYIAITDANKNFSKVAKICNEFGEVIILKNTEDAEIEYDVGCTRHLLFPPLALKALYQKSASETT